VDAILVEREIRGPNGNVKITKRQMALVVSGEDVWKAVFNPTYGMSRLYVREKAEAYAAKHDLVINALIGVARK
jgi:hypothetical protein